MGPGGPSEPVRRLVFVIPEKMLQSEIQDEIRLVKQSGCGVYVPGLKKGREIQDSSDLFGG